MSTKYSERLTLETNIEARRLFWEILHHKALYYVLSDPVISDMDFDLLEKEYEKLSGKESVVDFDIYDPISKIILRLTPKAIKNVATQEMLERRKRRLTDKS